MSKSRARKPNGKPPQAIEALEPRWKTQFDDFVHELAVSPRGDTVAVGGGSGLLSLLDAESGEVRITVESHFPGLCQLAFSPDSSRLATVGHDGHLRTWDTQTGDPCWKACVVSRKWVEHVCWLQDGRVVAASGKTLHFYDNTGELVHQTTLPGTALGMAQSPKPGGLLAISIYGGVLLIHPDTLEVTTQEWNGALLSPVWSPNGNHLAVGSQEGSIQIWQQDPPDRFEMSGYAGKIRAISFDSTGRYMATDGAEDCAIWDFSGSGPRGKQPILQRAHRSLLTAVAFRPMGIRLATAAGDGLFALWDLRRPMPGAAFLRENPVSRIAWQPDGRHIIVGYEDGYVVSFPDPPGGFS